MYVPRRVPTFLLFVLVILSLFVFNANASTGLATHEAAMKKRAELMRKRFPQIQSRQSGSGGWSGKNITFRNPKASAFYVDGTSIPEVDWNLGPSWAGLIPISSSPTETRKLFFWFFPPGPQGSLDDLIFWTNGGPGCSSLIGALQENGPLYWPPGQAKPVQNEYSWTNLSSILYVEQPVGTGFSQGIANIKNEEDLSAQLVGFFRQFLDVFSELKGKKLYLSGESYAGQYVPSIASYIYKNPNSLDLKLQGFWINNPLLSTDQAHVEFTVVDFVKEHAPIFALNDSFVEDLERRNRACGFEGYYDRYVTYPPRGRLPEPRGTYDPKCDLWSDVFLATWAVNPAFNLYRIWDTWPILWDVLGFPGSFPQTQQLPLYFDRTDVKKALHAPQEVSWTECIGRDVVFPTGDASPLPVVKALPFAIEKSKRSVIVHGKADFGMLYTGTRLILQNMTWNGQQGFRTPIKEESFVVDGMGVMGASHIERGLAYVEVALAGHMVPEFSPKAAFRIMQYLLGFKSRISD